MQNFLTRRYKHITIICIILGLIFDYFSNQYSIQPKIVSEIVNGQAIAKTIYQYEQGNLILKVLSSLLYNLGISLLIVVYFSSKLEEKENNEFKKQLIVIQNDFNNQIKQLQLDINRDVIEATFEKVIPQNLFEIVKKDVFTRQLIRKNAKWTFDFKLINNHIHLYQTLIYEMHNTGRVDSIWPFKLNYYSTEIEESQYTTTFTCKSPTGDIKYNLKMTEADKDKTINIDIEPFSYVLIAQTLFTVYKDFPVIQDTLTTVHPIINLEVIVIHPEEITIILRELFSTPLIERTQTPTMKVYEPIAGVLPGQGIIYTAIKKTTGNNGS